MELGKLATEQANPLSQAIETLSVAEITQRMNQEDQGVPLAVRQALPEINAFIEALVPVMAQGGRLFYMGRDFRPAGSLGCLGMSPNFWRQFGSRPRPDSRGARSYVPGY